MSFKSLPPLFSLCDKTAVITGSASGIGLEIATMLARQGAFVYLLDLNQEGVAAAAADIDMMAGMNTAKGLKCNVTDEASVAACFAIIAADGRRIDHLVNNAGIGHVGNVLNATVADLNRVMGVNVTGVFLCAQAAVAAMVADDKGGNIVNIGSCASIRPIKDRMVYAASKGAVLTMTKSLATDFVEQGIRCNCVCPGRIHTPFVDSFVKKNFPGEEQKNMVRLSEYMPLGRMGRPGEVAALVLYLCSDEARFVTGAAYAIDGGIFGVDHPKLYTTPHNKPHPAIASKL